ncbi:MAG: alanine--tRNA ligase, partial [Rudaea sp.]
GSPDEDGDRFIEIWNLVFMQFDRAADGTLSKLPAPCVDTGMGLERLAAVLQHVHSNYEIDLFQRLIKAAAALTNTADLENKSLRVIADHIRACSFLIVDGVLPSNEGRGYVLRRIIRRALRHGYMLGQKQPFFYKLVSPLVGEMGAAYPELAAKRAIVEKALQAEEERFGETLEHGMKVFERNTAPDMRIANKIIRERGRATSGPIDISVGNDKRVRMTFMDQITGTSAVVHVIYFASEQQAKDRFDHYVANAAKGGESSTEWVLVFDNTVSEQTAALLDSQAREFGVKLKIEVALENRVVDGTDAFRLYDTFGFPLDLTADMARERGLTVDMVGFEKTMNEQRSRARAASQFESKGMLSAEVVQNLLPTQFVGYEETNASGLRLVAIVRGDHTAQELGDGEEATLILDRTPFYAESGGQVGDAGTLSNADGAFVVRDTVKLAGSYHGHVGRWSGKQLRVGASLDAAIDASRRQAIVLNHSATHLLHAALRKVLGEHVTQKGSLVAPDRLRFDFSHFSPVTPDELARVEALVNDEVRRNVAADIRHMAYNDAIEFGAMALFGEKYGDEVRVLKMGDFSTELCGGTHVGRTGDIGLFKIIGESGVAAGIRRIEALTGAGALTFVDAEEARLEEIARLLSASGGDVVERLRALLDRQKKLEREIDALKAKATGAATADLAAGAKEIRGIKLIAARLEGVDAKALRDSVDRFKHQLVDCVVILAGASEGKVALVAGVGGAALGKVKAGELVAHVAAAIGGKGGGRADMAQGGGDDTPALRAALDSVAAFVEQHLQNKG